MSAADYRTLLASTPGRRPRRNLLVCADGRPSEEAEQRDFAASTIVTGDFAARRVLPPDLIVPADASPPT